MINNNKNYIKHAAAELETYKNLEKSIASLSKQKERLEEILNDVHAVDYEKVRVQGNPPGSDIVEIYVDLQTKIRKMEAEKESLKIVIEIKLELLNHLEQDVLRMYYVECMTIFEIACKLSYSERWIIRKKHDALENYANIRL